MKWKFWQKDVIRIASQAGQPNNKHGRPKGLPQQIGQYLVVREKMDPDWVWALRCVLRPRGQSRAAFDFRVFDPRSAGLNGVSVRDYASLDLHPEQILYFGWYHKYSHEVELYPGTPEKAA